MIQWLRNLAGRSGLPVAPARQSGESFSRISARYDNALTTPENKRDWWNTDYFSAKAANTYQVRRTLRIRSRHEVSNNPYLFGIANNNADDLIGQGPTLQVKTTDAAYNRRVEKAFAEWWAEVDGVEKLRTCKLAKTIDGEGFLVFKTVKDLENPVKLYPLDIEADQVTTPMPNDLGELWLDGLVLHPVTGRPVLFTILKQHPGDFYFPDLNPLAIDRIKAKWVIHWFPKFRPGQVRGVPTFTPSLDLFTELRAFRRATLGAAEVAADHAVLLQQDRATGAYGDQDNDQEYTPYEKVQINRKMMTMLPPGATASQLKAEHPTTTYEMFQEKCLGEACRPLSYPLNLALGTSQKFNFSSAKLDHINYRGALSVERAECDRVVMGHIFRVWFEEAALAGVVGMVNGIEAPTYEFHWPGYEPLDPVADATADHDRLSHGTETFREFWAKRGYDWRDVFTQLAAEKDELDRLGLEFGEPLKRTVTEQVDPASEESLVA